MKNQKAIFAATVLALAFALAAIAEAKPQPNGGPNRSSSTVRAVAANEAGAQLGMQEDILPLVRINFAPVGLTLDQTARLNLVNMDVANGITVSWRFIDANGATLAQSSTTLTIGKIFSVDFKRHPPPVESPEQQRAEVRVQLDIFTYGVSSDSLRRSLEVFDNYSGATSVYTAGGL